MELDILLYHFPVVIFEASQRGSLVLIRDSRYGRHFLCVGVTSPLEVPILPLHGESAEVRETPIAINWRRLPSVILLLREEDFGDSGQAIALRNGLFAGLR